MLKYVAIAAAAFTRAAAFTTIPAFSRAWPVDIQVSAEFTALETQVIAFAASTWNTALGSTALRRGRPPGVSTISKHSGTYLWANYGYNAWRILESDVIVSSALSGNAFHNTVLHELGHVLGLEHSDSSPIMGSKLTLSPLPVNLITVAADDVAGIRSLTPGGGWQPTTRPTMIAPAIPRYWRGGPGQTRTRARVSGARASSPPRQRRGPREPQRTQPRSGRARQPNRSWVKKHDRLHHVAVLPEGSSVVLVLEPHSWGEICLDPLADQHDDVGAETVFSPDRETCVVAATGENDADNLELGIERLTDEVDIQVLPRNLCQGVVGSRDREHPAPAVRVRRMLPERVNVLLKDVDVAIDDDALRRGEVVHPLPHRLYTLKAAKTSGGWGFRFLTALWFRGCFRRAVEPNGPLAFQWVFPCQVGLRTHWGYVPAGLYQFSPSPNWSEGHHSISRMEAKVVEQSWGVVGYRDFKDRAAFDRALEGIIKIHGLPARVPWQAFVRG